MKPLSLKNGIQFLSPEQQRMVALPVATRPNIVQWSEMLEVAVSTAYTNAKVLLQLGLFHRHSVGIGSGEQAQFYPNRSTVGRLLDINNKQASILDTTKLEQRILYIATSCDHRHTGILERQINKDFDLRTYLRQAERECRDGLLEYTQVVTHDRIVRDGCQLSAAGHRHVAAWREATRVMHPTLH